MGFLFKHTGKSTIVLCTAFLFLSLRPSSAAAIPTAKNINNMSEMAKLTTDTFMQESFELRMSYEFNGQFLSDDDGARLYKLAKRAGSDLQTTAENQQGLKEKIEDYQGDDWDEKYGLTGLWRKLSADIYTTKFSKCEIDYYLALSSDQPQRDKILLTILSEINSLSQNYREPKLVRGKVLALLAETDSAYRTQAIKEFEAFAIYSDILRPTRAEIEKIKLLGSADPNMLRILVETVKQNWDDRYIELVLSLAFLQREYDIAGLEKTVQIFPRIEDFLGSLILSKLCSEIEPEPLRQISVFEAELAAEAAWKNETKSYKTLLARLSKIEKFQTPLTLYVTAVAFAESSPNKAIELLIKASNLQQLQRSNKLNVEAEKIAEQAAQLAYNLFAEDSANCRLALRAFDNYCDLAAEKNDEELEYLYSSVLNNCGKEQEAKRLLQKIADRDAGQYRYRARLELAAQTIRQKHLENMSRKIKLARQMSSLTTKVNDCQYADEAMELLLEIVAEIDELQIEDSDFRGIVQDSKKLAQFCYGCFDSQQAGLILAEISVFAANKEKQRLSSAEKLLDNIAKDGGAGNVDFLRCRARLLTEQSKFNKAAGLWAQVAKIQKNKSSQPNKRSWKWWRAKFYELYCWSKIPQTKKEELLHSIEVLENSFPDIPPLWAEKLRLLKQAQETLP